MSYAPNIKQLDQSNWVCYQFQNNTYYYGEVGYLDESGIVHSKDSAEAASNPKNKLVKHGVGVYLWNVSEAGTPQCKYQGNWDRDEKSGKGAIKYADGTFYDGSFHEGHYHGSGKMVWPNGDQYEGNWKRSKMDGSGLFKHSTGFVLKGLFKNNYFIDENFLRNPFLNEKEYSVFKKERKEILKQKEKQEKLKHGFSIKINHDSAGFLKQPIDKSSSNNRVPLVLSTKNSQYNLQSFVQDLNTNYPNTQVNIFDLRKLYTLQGQGKWTYRKDVHEMFRDSLAKGEIFVLNLDESDVKFSEMFYPDVKQFYEPNGFNSISWSREQLKLLEVRKRIIGENANIHDSFKLIVWTKFKVDSSLNEQNIRQKLQIRFEKIIPFIKIDCIIFDKKAE